MRVAKKDLQQDTSPFDAGRQCYLDGRPIDVGLRLSGISYKMIDATEAFHRGYESESRDQIEAVSGREIDSDDRLL